MPVLTATGKRVVVAVVVVGLLVVAGAVVAVLRRDAIAAWLDAPDVLAVNRATLELELPPGLADDATFSAARAGALPVRTAWADQAPRDAVADVAEALRRDGVDVDDVRCNGEGPLPRVLHDGEVVCAAPAPVRGVSLWVVATDRTTGGVPLGRTALWFEWDPMAPELADRVYAEEPYASVADAVLERLSPAEVAAVLPPRFSGALDTCTGETATDCYRWQGAVDTSDLPADDVVPALVRELTEHGFMVASADASWTEDITAHRRFGPGLNLLRVVIRREGDGLVAVIIPL